ncbi:MAG TPA: rhodanese-like domain-containing protein [Rhodocyclaceae bacterium]|nr:rhodanese-like domain-containing protein [Rhodocyclaceae bacterium]
MKRKLLTMLLAAAGLMPAGIPALAADKTPEQLIGEARAAIRQVSVDEVKHMIDTRENIVILDVRDQNELADGRISGAINISRGMLEFMAGSMLPDKNAKIVVYCSLDMRGPMATRTLNQLGYHHAVNMTGALKAWQAAGYPLVK